MLLLLPTLVPMALSAQPADDGFLVVAQDWEARRLTSPDAVSPRCAVRAYHPWLDAGEVMWVFDPAVADRFPNGYLFVDRRLATPDAVVDAVAQDGRIFRLPRAHDRHAYSRSGDSGDLFESMRRDFSLTLAIASPASGEQNLILSLLGFSRAADTAAAACAFLP